jgi:hypothetical protein
VSPLSSGPPCPHTTKSGGICRGRTQEHWDGKCFVHYRADLGLPQPQQYRRKATATSVDRLLSAFGLPKSSIQKLRDAVPEVDSIMATETTLADALSLTTRAVTVRVIASPERRMADALAVLVRLSDSLGEGRGLRPVMISTCSKAHDAHRLEASGQASSVQAQNDQYITHTVVVQVHGPVVVAPENFTVAHIVNPNTIEDLVDSVLTALKTIQIGSAYWFLRPNRVDYPSAPNGQQTRAEIAFDVYDGSTWL